MFAINAIADVENTAHFLTFWFGNVKARQLLTKGQNPLHQFPFSKSATSPQQLGNFPVQSDWRKLRGNVCDGFWAYGAFNIIAHGIQEE